MKGWLARCPANGAGRWERRWCVLEDGRFEYYEYEDVVLQLGPACCAVPFRIPQAPEEARKLVTEKPFGFVLDVGVPEATPRFHYFDAVDSTTLEAWTTAFEREAQRLEARRLSPSRSAALVGPTLHLSPPSSPVRYGASGSSPVTTVLPPPGPPLPRPAPSATSSPTQLKRTADVDKLVEQRIADVRAELKSRYEQELADARASIETLRSQNARADEDIRGLTAENQRLKEKLEELHASFEGSEKAQADMSTIMMKRLAVETKDAAQAIRENKLLQHELDKARAELAATKVLGSNVDYSQYATPAIIVSSVTAATPTLPDTGGRSREDAVSRKRSSTESERRRPKIGADSDETDEEVQLVYYAGKLVRSPAPSPTAKDGDVGKILMSPEPSPSAKQANGEPMSAISNSKGEVKPAADTTPATPPDGVESRGTCRICGNTVWTNQPRVKEDGGGYVLKACLEKEQAEQAAKAAEAADAPDMPREEGLLEVAAVPPAKVLAAPAPLKELQSRLGPGPRICILSDGACQEADTEALLVAVAERLAREPELARANFVTRDLQGTQATQELFAKNCGDGARVWHLWPTASQSSSCKVGATVCVGNDAAECSTIFCSLGHVYIVAEGGHALAKQAQQIHNGGAAIVPLMRTGGASAGLFDFPAGAMQCPASANEAQWALLSNKEVPPTETAAAAIALVVGFVASAAEAASAAAATGHGGGDRRAGDRTPSFTGAWADNIVQIDGEEVKRGAKVKPTEDTTPAAVPDGVEARGTCRICGNTVWTNQPRVKEADGGYVLKACLEKEQAEQAAKAAEA